VSTPIIKFLNRICCIKDSASSLSFFHQRLLRNFFSEKNIKYFSSKNELVKSKIDDYDEPGNAN
jgi:hypothetical protein